MALQMNWILFPGTSYAATIHNAYIKRLSTVTSVQKVTDVLYGVFESKEQADNLSNRPITADHQKFTFNPTVTYAGSNVEATSYNMLKTLVMFSTATDV